MLKYLGSKRMLAPVLGDVAEAVGARTALDLFTGTTRVARELKRRGLQVSAADIATYSQVLADCYVATDATTVDVAALDAVLAGLAALPGRAGYFTETFCERSRFVQPHNGARVDAVREALERDHRGSPLFPVLLTSLLLATDRVDSTTGVQMAYLKQWSPRSYRDLELRRPDLLPGDGRTLRGDVSDVLDVLEREPVVDFAYLDPPYNQHRYYTNYHVWETLVRWDAPAHYGVACKRLDARDDATKSRFNVKRAMPAALAETIRRVRAEVVAVSYNDESWVGVEQMTGWLRDAGHARVEVVAFDRKRYVGAQIGVFNPAGVRVGQASRLRNTEYLFLAGDADRVEAAVRAASAPQTECSVPGSVGMSVVPAVPARTAVPPR